MGNTKGCTNVQDCLEKLEFVSTTNGGYELVQTTGTTPTGDCVVIATSMATGLTYVEARRRLALLANSLEKFREDFAAIPDRLLVLDIPEDIADRNPIHGTHPITCSLFLITHFFDRRNTSHCVCDKSAPHVLTGTTDDGSLHAVAVINGQAYGTYDVTVEHFEAVDVWESEQEPIPPVTEWLGLEFTNQRSVNAHVTRRLLAD